MDKDPLFEAMWAELGKLGFRHQQKYGRVFKQLYLAERNAAHIRDQQHLAFIRKWLLVPYSFWPIDFGGLGRYVASEVAAGRTLKPQIETILGMLRRMPSKAAQQIIIEHESEVEAGEYGRFMRVSAKFEAMQRAKMLDPRFQADWARLCREHNIEKYRNNPRRIIRRTMVMERNFKPPEWMILSLDEEEELLQLAIDALCYDHCLYGVEGDGKPLLLKVTVNVTAFGLLIGVPSYLLPDFKRDFNWNNMAKLLEALGAESIGEKRASTEQEKIDIAVRTLRAAERADALGLVGAERIQFIVKEGSHPPSTDARKIRKLVALAKEHEDANGTKLENGSV